MLMPLKSRSANSGIPAIQPVMDNEPPITPTTAAVKETHLKSAEKDSERV